MRDKIRRTHVREIDRIHTQGLTSVRSNRDARYELIIESDGHWDSASGAWVGKETVLHLDRYDIRSLAEELNRIVDQEQAHVDHLKAGLRGE